MTLTPEGYRHRLIDSFIDKQLESFGAVSIEGPKWCGKTWTALHHSNSVCQMNGYTGPIKNSDLVASNPEKALVGDKPRLIDEWQEMPPLWDLVRLEVDKSSEKDGSF